MALKTSASTTPLPFEEKQTVAPLRIVQSSSYVVDHSNSLSLGAKPHRDRNYYPAAVQESRNYDRDRKEELLEELIDLLSESIHHRYEDKVVFE